VTTISGSFVRSTSILVPPIRPGCRREHDEGLRGVVGAVSALVGADTARLADGSHWSIYAIASGRSGPSAWISLDRSGFRRWRLSSVTAVKSSMRVVGECSAVTAQGHVVLG